MGADLRQAFKRDNLRRAWRWLNTNPDASYKSYFRHIYRSYSISADQNIDDLRKRLAIGSYTPQHATKLYLPKKSGIQRTYTLLALEDQIVYQALINVVADRMLPTVKKKYHKQVFGNLYAGQRSKFFYRDWRRGYRRFGDSLRDIHRRGFIYAASFDLTACYDSIDHSVLSHFLGDIGLQKEFIDLLRKYLRIWTAAPAENRIYQGHGIPQGPLSSGLLSENVLRYFDENHHARPRSWRYFRYVDDIRFFAKDERDLRSVLVDMDLLSKRIGLFPQSNKIDIHRVTNIEDEIKSISHPPEPVGIRKHPNQRIVMRRIADLTPRFEITNETRFKFVLAGALPNARLSVRLIRILERYPHTYVSVFNYFRRYTNISKAVCKQLLDHLKASQLYASYTAEGLRTLRDHCHPSLDANLERYARAVFTKDTGMGDSDLRAAAVSILLARGKLRWQETLDYVEQEADWWPRSEVARHLSIDHVGKPSYEFVINRLLCDSSVDVSVVAVDHLSSHSLEVIVPIDQINPIAQLALKKLGVIGARRGGPSPIATAMQSMISPSLAPIKWKQLLGGHYPDDIAVVIRLKGYSESDATAWVNLIDIFHDDLLDSLFGHEGGVLGNYSHGHIGAALGSPRSRFAAKFPSAYVAFNEVHKTRLQSMLSHPITRATGKRTRYIEYDFLKKIRPKLAKAYLEIWRKW